jgi:lysyl-tRNA synthetase class 2
MSAGLEESNNVIDYYQQKVDSIIEQKKAGINPYPHKFDTTHTFQQVIEQYSNIPDGEHLKDQIVKTAGRVLEIRVASKKLYFMSAQSNGYNLQYLANEMFYDDKDKFRSDMSSISRGDIVGVVGIVGKSKKGELSILPKSITILAPCLHEIPKQFFGLADVDVRFKQRYLDMIVNPKVQQTLVTRAKIISFIRNYLDNKGFIEVETPILTMNPGGANAAKFTTYHNDLKRNMFMRIAPELYLKQLVIGGMNKVYELNKNFRNENLDSSHHTEFTAIEYYEAYADYHDMMKSAEDLLSKLVMYINGSYKLKFSKTDGIDVELDFTPPFKRVDIMTTLTDKISEKIADFKFPNDLGSEDTRQYLIKICDTLNVPCSNPKTVPRLIDKLIGHFIEPVCINPTFVINQPLIMSPLAKWHRDNPQLTERFEIFVNGFEIANAYTELNDPFVQKQTFTDQAKAKDAGDEEAQVLDNDYIRALEYGLPPTGGQGFGIDRLVMLLTNNNTIREVLTFAS